MNQLARQTALTIARLGLFLSVVLWLTKNHFEFSVTTPVLQVRVISEGIAIIFPDPPAGWSIKREITDPGFYYVFDFPPPDSVASRLDFEFLLVRDGLLILRCNNQLSVGIRHWVIVTFLSLCYAGLTWLYRKRPDAPPQPPGATE